MAASISRLRAWRDHPWLWLAPAVTNAALIFLVRALPTTLGTAIWPTSAVFAALMLLVRPDQRLKGFVASVLVVMVPTIFGGSPLLSMIGLSEAWALCLLTEKVCGPNPDFSRGRTLSRLIMVILPVTLVSGGLVQLLSVLPPAFAGGSGPPAMRWVISHSLGAVLFLPALSVLLDQSRYARISGALRDLTLSLIALVVAASALFLLQDRSLAVFIFPMAMLITFRHGPVGSATATLLLALLTFGYLYGHGAGSFGDPGLLNTVQWAQMLIVVVLLTTLPAGGAIAMMTRMRALLVVRTGVAEAARRKADQAAASKGEFLANLSHEIRTPLNGVIGLADALSRSDLKPQQRELLQMILASGKALTGLLSDALDLARADSGALRLSIEPIDIRQTVSEAAYLFESLAQEKNIGFSVAFDLDQPGVMADSLRIKQIVSNLISNAVKFTEKGEVEVKVGYRVAEGAGHLEITVRDTGPGFSEEVKARLFQRFEQADASVTRRFGGSGLGLSIASTLAHMMQGALSADARPGEGATFRLWVPLEPAALRARAPSAEAANVEALGARAIRVLVAEDNHINQKVIQAMIGEFVELTMVGNGELAVEAFQAQAYDVILMDTHMPVLDGLSAIRRIRAQEAAAGLARTPIISLTADAMPQQVEAARAAGADLHVAKPITAETLLGALQSALDGVQASAAA